MKIIFSVILVVMAFSCLSQAPSFEWATSTGGPNNELSGIIKSDANGNIYVIGDYQGTIDFDPGPGSMNLSSNGSNDIFIQKFDLFGALIYAKSFGGPNLEYASDLEFDTNGNIYITGQFRGTVDFDPNIGLENLTASSNGDGFILKLSSLGNFIWVKQIIGVNTSNLGKVSFNSQNEIFCVGTFSGTQDVDLSSGTYNLTSNGGVDFFIAKYDQNGSLIWVKQIGNGGNDGVGGFSLDQDDNILISGSFVGVLDFDPGPNVSTLTSSGLTDGFILKLNSSGSFLWVDYFSGSGYDYFGTIDCDAQGNIYALAQFQGDVSLDLGNPVFSFNSNGSTDLIVAKIAANGDPLWAKQIGGVNIENVGSLTCDSYGNSYCSATFGSTVGFDNGNQTLTSNGALDLFIQKLNTNGDLLWLAQIGGTSNEFCTSINYNDDGSLYISGYFDGVATDFNPEIGVNNLTTNGQQDLYALKFSQCVPTFSEDVIVSCDNYTWTNGVTYSSSNNSDFYTLTNAGGCDSIISLNLTINQSDTVVDIINSCDPVTWINGVTYSISNNSATHILTNSTGCDSIINLNLTINSNFMVDSHSACESYTWIDGITYTSSNNSATHILTNSFGCDSIINLNLTINTANSAVDIVSACESYTWIDGITYNSNNSSATHILMNSAGCDSIVTLNLTIHNSTTGVDVITACDSYTWMDGNTYTSSNNTATHFLLNSVGCDSVVTLNLAISYASYSTDVIFSCDSIKWIDDNTYTSSNNTATYVLTNMSGCDSTITLDLTINTDAVIDYHNECNSLTWIDGNTYTSSNNSATHTLTNIYGCDSIVTLNLSINSNSSIDVQSSCGPYTWIDGITYTSTNNSAAHILTNSFGCDSIITLNLTINNVDVGTSINDITITSNTANGQYQWLDCDNNYEVLLGETAQSYTPDYNSSFAVEVLENGCTDTSACVLITTVGITENDVMSQIRVFPNPATDIINISSKEEIESIALLDISGKTIKTILNESTLKVGDVTPGIYWVKVRTASDRVRMQKVVISQF